MPQCQQQSSYGRECFKPRLRLGWDTRITERYLEENLAEGLDEPEREEKARFDEIISSSGALPLSDVQYAIVASAIANSACSALPRLDVARVCS